MRNHMRQRHDLTPDQPEYAESIHSTIDKSKKSLDSIQLADDSRSSEAKFLIDRDIGVRNGEDSGDSSRSDDKKSSEDEEAASVKKNHRNIVKSEFIDTSSPNMSSNYGNTNGEGTLRIKTENMLEYEYCDTGLDSTTSNEASEILRNIKEEIVDPLYEGTNYNLIENRESSSTQIRENSGAIIPGRIKTEERDIGNNCREIASELKDIVRSESESSKDISRRKKQLRTPKKYISPVVSLCRIDDKLKNVLPKRERVEAIARSLKNSTTMKREFC